MADKNIRFTDFIDSGNLQKMQDAFSKMAGVASLITNAEGMPITEPSRFTRFCRQYTQTEEGYARCSACIIRGIRLAFESGTSVTYRCHAGLTVFAAPIMADEQFVGCFIGGQVLQETMGGEKIRQLSAEAGIAADTYAQALTELPVLTPDKIQRAVAFFHTIANILSGIMYHNYLAQKENDKIRRATTLKSDFLANMSHEIRTPMNAIIGLAQMAQREELTPQARKCIAQIQSSGKILLAIINDILDFSKIESGKLEINLSEYEPMSLINDISNLVMTGIGTKEVQLILDVSPDIPLQLLGDSLRIKQIFVNLCNNAVKFTKIGYIILKVDAQPLSLDEVMLSVSIQDTGIGIKKADLEKLFQSFQQVDSKRNRNLEGTGLGLAISRQLLNLMMGDIQVVSEYGKGSTFSFQLPQRITRSQPAITLRETKPLAASALFADPVVKKQIVRDIKRLGVRYVPVDSAQQLLELEELPDFLFIGRALFHGRLEEFVRLHRELMAVLVIEFNDSVRQELPNLLIVKKPLYSLNMAMIFNREDLQLKYSSVSDVDYEFVAPDAHILIVDDNGINLTIAEGLLRPLRLQIDTALSGREAINKISLHHYDLIFMDHQMPDMDGIETTAMIRSYHREYAAVPIIAFTANASVETEAMFLNKGFNDCLAKPIELRMLLAKLKRWLPREKLQKISDHEKQPMTGQFQAAPDIAGLDTDYAIRLLGSEKLFWEVLLDYYRVIREKAEKIRLLVQREDWKNYTIEVHALKSASRQIGAMQLSELAKELETAGNAKDAAAIHEKTGALLAHYLQYEAVLRPFFPEKEKTGGAAPIPHDRLQDAFARLRQAAEMLDMDLLWQAVSDMEPYRYEGEYAKLFERLKSAAANLDVDACEQIAGEWEERDSEWKKSFS